MNILRANLVSLSGISRGMFNLRGKANAAPDERFPMWPVSGQIEAISDILSRLSHFDFELGG